MNGKETNKPVPAKEVISAAREKDAPPFWLRILVVGITHVPRVIAGKVTDVFQHFRLRDSQSGKEFKSGMPASHDEVRRWEESQKKDK